MESAPDKAERRVAFAHGGVPGQIPGLLDREQHAVGFDRRLVGGVVLAVGLAFQQQVADGRGSCAAFQTARRPWASPRQTTSSAPLSARFAQDGGAGFGGLVLRDEGLRCIAESGGKGLHAAPDGRVGAVVQPVGRPGRKGDQRPAVLQRIFRFVTVRRFGRAGGVLLRDGFRASGGRWRPRSAPGGRFGLGRGGSGRAAGAQAKGQRAAQRPGQRAAQAAAAEEN